MLRTRLGKQMLLPFVFLRGNHFIEICDKYSESNPLRTSTGLFCVYVVLGEATVNSAMYLEGC